MDFDEDVIFGEKDEEESNSRKRLASSTSSSDSEDTSQTIKANPTIKGRDMRPIGNAIRNIRRTDTQTEDPMEKMKSKLGTSMPINIRQSPAHAATKILDQADDEHRANTFVAFHNMEQPVDYSQKATSLSNGSVAKRERLLQRNKILRRTGFIEAETQLPGGGKFSEPALPELMDPLNRLDRRIMPIKESHLEAGALSAAFASPNSHQEAEPEK